MPATLLDKLNYLEKLSISINIDERMVNAKLKATAENPFFTPDFIALAFKGIAQFLDKEKLTEWTANYPFLQMELTPKKVAVIMAGNIPLVGFHDFLCVYLTSHFIQLKVSSKDSSLIKIVVDILAEIDPTAAERISLVERLVDFDAVIATGSDNSFRYFEYYFKNKPSLLRKNRNSVAVLRGDENDAQLQQLADDIFLYFGLGCRNVSKLYVPMDFKVERLFPNFEKYNWMHHHSKYMNNYDYHRAIYLLNSDVHLADEKVMLIENKSLSSPLAVLHYERYESVADLSSDLIAKQNDLQCIVGDVKVGEEWLNLSCIPFGKSQFPVLNDYADKIDTLLFLESINE